MAKWLNRVQEKRQAAVADPIVAAKLKRIILIFLTSKIAIGRCISPKSRSKSSRIFRTLRSNSFTLTIRLQVVMLAVSLLAPSLQSPLPICCQNRLLFTSIQLTPARLLKQVTVRAKHIRVN